MTLRETSDASFFALVHHVLESHGEVEPAERRDNQRRKFSCLQLVAPYRNGAMPTREDFRTIRCHDISPTGFSFYNQQPPQEEYLIAALGSPPSIFLSAEVVHSSPAEVDGVLQYLVGCRFVSRVMLPGFRAPAALR